MIVDSPPLTDVIDALPLVDYVDDVVLVAGVGKTHLGKLAQLGELLAEHGIRPAGFAVVGTPEAQPVRLPLLRRASAATSACGPARARGGGRAATAGTLVVLGAGAAPVR